MDVTMRTFIGDEHSQVGISRYTFLGGHVWMDISPAYFELDFAVCVVEPLTSCILIFCQLPNVQFSINAEKSSLHFIISQSASSSVSLIFMLSSTSFLRALS
jgi:hypothetical protein